MRRTLLLLVLALHPSAASAVEMPPPNPQAGMLRNVKFLQNLGADVPLDLEFLDENGSPVRLGDLVHNKPVVLTLNYYECPMLCTLELNGLIRAMSPMTFDVGKEFDVVTVSIDPSETPELAKRKKASYLRRYKRPTAETGWHFLTGKEVAIKKLTDVAGFKYVYDPRSKQFAHAAGILVLTPKGKISRYFLGVDYPPRELRLAIVEASSGKVGGITDQLLLYCFHYDPLTGKYNLAIMNILRFLGVVTMGSLAGYMALMFRRDLRLGKMHPAPAALEAAANDQD